MDVWDVTTCLVKFHSVLSTVFEFSKSIEPSAALQPSHHVDPQGHELPKSLVNIVIRTDIRCLCAQIDGLLRDPVAYQDFSKARDDDAQQLLDLLQDLLDNPLLDSPIRPVIWKALLKLSKKSSRYPRCFALPELQLTGPPVAGGSFADIWKSHLHNETVCVKVMRVFATVEVETLLKGFHKEAIIWRQLAHPNLLPFFGVYFLADTRPRLCLVSPWMENGNIYNYLRSNTAGINRLTLVLDVAIGLEHLHSLKLVHGDLKAINVLVTRSGRAVLADFGLSSVAMDSKIPDNSFGCQIPKIRDLPIFVWTLFIFP
ncbi:kinase-like domain-containing protein [Mycena galericulata]|nr:kinase-like domain-containing protein [Mycena galericulata]